ncbi:MAG: hypothetical protein IJ574_04040 [Bacilli bacterium]|nr:hypothetical protein [Bacilli bacterium]
MGIFDNIRDILKYNKVEDIDIEFLYKKIGVIAIINKDNAMAVSDVLKENGINVYNSVGVVEFKLFLLDSEDIKNKIDSLKNVEELDLFKMYPEKLIENPPLKYYQRIKQCQNSNISYKDENGYKDFIVDDAAWELFANEQSKVAKEESSIDEQKDALLNLRAQISDAKDYINSLSNENERGRSVA